MGPKSQEKLKAMLLQNVWGKRENDEYAGIDRIAIILVARSSSWLVENVDGNQFDTSA